MSETRAFGLLVLVASGIGLLAVLSNRVSERVRLPTPALFLVGAAIAQAVIPDLHPPPQRTVERVVTVALLLILFDGGQHIGWTRFRSAAAPISLVGVIGTLLTVIATAMLAHAVLHLAWYASALLATAISPTDPAVVFSVLGQREIAGRSATILEGESGMNDPVGIALMVGLLAAGGIGLGAIANVGETFVLEMAVGATVGLVGGRGLLWFMRRVTLPGEGLYPLRTLASMMVLFGVATVAHGSGFLAVFIAGVVTGDAHAPYKREIERFHSALASLGEIVAFFVLGLTIDLHVLAHINVWLPGIVLGGALALLIRPLLVGICLLPARLRRNEQAFVLFAGLKGAVPILLGSLLLAGHVAGEERLYGIIIVVVLISVIAQGSLIGAAARLLGLPMRTIEPEPWALGVRLRDQPEGVHRLTVAPGSPADGTVLESIAGLPPEAWISFVVRDLRLVPISSDTRLQAGDEVLVLGDPSLRDPLTAVFQEPSGSPAHQPRRDRRHRARDGT